MNITREEFALKFNGYVKTIAKHYCDAVGDIRIEYDDLCQVGYLALMEGYDKYDSSKSSPSTYAHMIIRYKVLRYITDNRSVTHVPHDLQALSVRLARKRAEYYTVNGKQMSINDMIKCLENTHNFNYEVNLKLIKLLLIIEKYHKNTHEYSFEDKIDNYDAFSLTYLDNDEFAYINDIIKDNYNLEDEIIKNNELEEIKSYLEDNFDEMDIDIFKETLGLTDEIPKTRRVLGEKYGITPQAIDLRYKKVLNNVRRNFDVL